MKTSSITLFAVLIFGLGCTKVDFNNIDDLQYKGKWAVPLVNAKLSLSNIIENDTNFTVDPDGGVRVIYSEDSIYAYQVNDLVSVPDQDPINFPMVTGAPPIVIETGLGVLAGAKLQGAVFSAGHLNWSFNSTYNGTLEVQMKINNATLNGAVAQFDFIANNSGTTTGVIDITDLDFDFTTGALGYNDLSFELAIVNDGGAPAGTPFDLEIQFVDVMLKEADGYFGDRTLNLNPSSSLKPNISGFRNFLKGLYLEDPRVLIDVKSNVGLPLEVDAKVDGINIEGKMVGLNLSPYQIPGPPTAGQWDTTVISIDRNNSNIVDFVANVPEEIVYSGCGKDESRPAKR